MKYALIICIGVFMVACTPHKEPSSKEEAYLHQKEQEQGYPVLIAVPKSANYGLPFCEKQYCIDVEIFSFDSQDKWFNLFIDQQIAHLIRMQIGEKQKLSLQNAVDEFVRQSDQWQEQNTQQPWSIYIEPRVVLQQGELTITQIKTEYGLGDRHIPQRVYYSVVDRKQQQHLKLYDIIKDNKRVTFGLYLEESYKKWLSERQNSQNYIEKIYWANQDWFFDEHGVAIYYRGADLKQAKAADTKLEDFTLYLNKEQINDWVVEDMVNKMGFKMTDS